MNNIYPFSTIVYKNIFNVSMTMTENDVLNKFPWLVKVKHILISYGFNNIWNNHSFINIKWLKITTKQ